ncbi:hypothetical protein KC336_g92 [Hortaea werneckii]|nr:hypothetical protein KC336_g92 [Hortaea werneckii]
MSGMMEMNQCTALIPESLLERGNRRWGIAGSKEAGTRKRCHSFVCVAWTPRPDSTHTIVTAMSATSELRRANSASRLRSNFSCSAFSSSSVFFFFFISSSDDVRRKYPSDSRRPSSSSIEGVRKASSLCSPVLRPLRGRTVGGVFFAVSEAVVVVVGIVVGGPMMSSLFRYHRAAAGITLMTAVVDSLRNLVSIAEVRSRAGTGIADAVGGDGAKAHALTPGADLTHLCPRGLPSERFPAKTAAFMCAIHQPSLYVDRVNVTCARKVYPITGTNAQAVKARFLSKPLVPFSLKKASTSLSWCSFVKLLVPMVTTEPIMESEAPEGHNTLFVCPQARKRQAKVRWISFGSFARPIARSAVLRSSAFLAVSYSLTMALYSFSPPYDSTVAGSLGLLVARRCCTAEQKSLELLLNVAVLVGKFPAELVRLAADEITLESFERILGLFIFEDPCSANSTNTSSDFIPDNEVWLSVKALQQGQEAGRLLVARSSQCTGVCDHSSAVLNRQKTILSVLTELLKTLRCVVSAVDTRVIGVKLVKVHIRHLEVALAVVQGQILIHAVLRPEAQEDRVKSLVLFWLHISSAQEAVLLEVDLIFLWLFVHGYDREANLLGPDVCNTLNVLTTGIAQSSPEIPADTLHEHVLSKMLRNHANDTGALRVRNGIKNLVDLIRPLDRDLDWVRAAQRVQAKGRLQVIRNVSLPHLPLRVESVAGVPAHPRSKTLVQPQAIPEVHATRCLVEALAVFSSSSTSTTRQELLPSSVRAPSSAEKRPCSGSLSGVQKTRTGRRKLLDS